MATKKRLDQLPAILSGDVGNNDLMYLVNENAQAETGYDSKKILVAEVAKKLLGGVELPTDLPDFPANEQNALSALEYLNAKINDLYPVVTESGSLASFTTPLALPLVSLKANITAQGGGGTPSSPVAIIGFDSVTAKQYGKNLCPNIRYQSTTNSIVIGQDNATDFSFYLKAGVTYTLSTETTLSGYRAFYRETNDESGTEIGTAGVVSKQPRVFTVPKDGHYRIAIAYATGDITDESLKNIQLEVGNTATTYEAYKTPNTFTVSLGETIYGGVLDCKNGKKTITHGYIDLGDLSWSYSETPQQFRATLPNVKLPSSGNIKADAICSAYECVAFNSLANNTFAIFFASKQGINVKNSDYTDADTFKTAMTGQKLVYELATPIEITGLTPDNFTTIAGQNNIFADSGDVELSFKQGIQEYIDAKIAETQALIL